MTGRTTGALLIWLVVVGPWWGCSPANESDGGPDGDNDGDIEGSDADADADIEEDGDSALDADLPSDAEGVTDVALTGVQPAHGPFTGGTEVMLRGRGFVEGMGVRFGGHEVDPADVTFIDDNRLRVVTPASEPGLVDVTLVTEAGDEVTLAGGYTYDAWYLDPDSGSVGGGTLVHVYGFGAEFRPESEMTFDGAEATDLEWIGPAELVVRTPPGEPGPADVTLTDERGSTTLREAFTYYDSADPRSGGLGGGPIEGTIEVTVLDDATRAPLPDSFVMLGTDPETPFQGRTNAEGRITFSDPSLQGRQTVTASHGPVEVRDDDGTYIGDMLYESTTIVAFDARAVTILLQPIPPPQPGSPPPGRRGGYIEGELLFEHRGEFGPYEWDIVPEPGPDEVKVAYVYTTQGSVRSTRIEARGDAIVYNSPEYIGMNGYRFRVYSSPGTVAVYAFAGLGRLSDPSDPTSIVEFTPYVMGLARGVVVGPDETVEGVQVLMVRQMSQRLEVSLVGAPLADDSGVPNTYIVESYLDLGAEGVISRPETTIRRSTPFGSFVFPGWVELTGELSDATYTVVAGAWTTRGGSDDEQNPWSVVYRTGITDLTQPVVIDDFLAVPRARTPEPGGVVEGRHFEWTAEDGVTPDFSIAALTVPSGIMPQPLWFVVLRGGVTTFDLPDLSVLMEDAPDEPLGNVTWEVWSFSVKDEFDFDSWSYRYLYSRYWSAYAVDSWYIRLHD